jgi:hypothetical protein
MDKYMMDEYISQLTAQEKKVLKIAQEHLASSFSLEKSIGYKQWQGAMPGGTPPHPPLEVSEAQELPK